MMKLQNPYLPCDQQDIDNLPVDEMPEDDGDMKIYRVSKDGDKETFRVPSTSIPNTYYLVDKLHTTADTYVYRCECIGYTTRGYKVMDYECRHIKAVKEFERQG